MSEDQIRELVTKEVNRAFTNIVPELINGVRDQFNALLEERFATVTAAGVGPPREFTYRDFSACAPSEFKGELDPTMALHWISDIEGVFHTCGYPDNLKVRYALNLLRGPAKDWWKLQAADMTEEQRGALLWNEFMERFHRQYVPRVEIERITRDFLSYRQKNETVTELTIRFREMALFRYENGKVCWNAKGRDS
ncbi:hypothetical protein OSB04_028090 [Centaurea solstitialis]|uniref:Retrotransposon gag domain-containing protein n=1 Tax=Centaurea solstitialis TaxID=347529 RepID=A0AA38SGK7_9ASTR|nr:hypothetical protein OSB04_028090 [Centaurea solstitialis]